MKNKILSVLGVGLLGSLLLDNSSAIYTDCMKESEHNLVSITCEKIDEDNVDVIVRIRDLPEDSEGEILEFLFYKENDNSVKYKPLELASDSSGSWLEDGYYGGVRFGGLEKESMLLTSVYVVGEGHGDFYTDSIDSAKIETILEEESDSCFSPGGKEQEEKIALTKAKDSTLILVCQNGRWVQKSDSSEENTGNTNPSSSSLHSPQNLSYDEESSHSILLSWEDLENLGDISYRVYRDEVLVGVTEDLSFLDSDLDSGVSYSYRVLAGNGVVFSEGSEPLSVELKINNSDTTPEIVPPTTSNEFPSDLPSGKNWVLEWSDEFNGSDGSLPGDAWYFFDGWDNDYVWRNAYYEDGKNAVHDGEGNMVITSERVDGQNRAGYIKTFDWSASQSDWRLYGPGENGRYIEARVRLDKIITKGQWVAFWMVGANNNYDGDLSNGSEVDIMEYVKADASWTNSSYNLATHWNPHGGENAGKWVSPEDHGTNLQEGYHTFGLEIYRDSMTYYIDGTAVYTTTKGVPTGERQAIVLSTEIADNVWGMGGTYSSSYNGTPDEFIIDYVRVFERSNESSRSNQESETSSQTENHSSAPETTETTETSTLVSSRSDLEKLSLREIVEHDNFPKKNFLVGFGFPGEDYDSSNNLVSAHINVTRKESNFITPTYVLKMNATQKIKPTNLDGEDIGAVYDFSYGDKNILAVNGDRKPGDEGFNYTHGHVFVWHSANPDWFMDGDITKVQATKIMKDRIIAHLRNFRGKDKGVIAWDVVNEAIKSHSVTVAEIEAFKNDKSSKAMFQPLSHTYKPYPWYELFAPAEYIELAFKFAREEINTWPEDERPLLLYNDYFILWQNTKVDATYELVKYLNRNEKLVDGIGIQAHLATRFAKHGSFGHNHPDQSLTPNETVPAAMSKLASLDVDLFLTEVDVAISTGNEESSIGTRPLTTTEKNEQKQLYKDTMRHCLEEPRCRSFQTWGITDSFSWKEELQPLMFGGSPIQENGEWTFAKKDAYYGVQEALIEFAIDPSNH